MSDFRPIRLACSHGPDLHFDGKLCGSYTTQNKAGTKQRWTELRLWETPGGNWIAESVGCSSRDGEGEIREARVIEMEVYHDVEVVRTPPRLGSGGYLEAENFAASDLGPKIDEDARMGAAMEAWGWTTAAKAFARELGWDMIRRVE